MAEPKAMTPPANPLADEPTAEELARLPKIPARTNAEIDADTIFEVGTQYDMFEGEAFDLDDYDQVLEGEVVTLEEQWQLIPDSEKGILIGEPFVIMGIGVVKSDLSKKGRYFNVRCITKNVLPGYEHKRICFNDSSTGVSEQLEKIIVKMAGEPKPIRIKGGLRASFFCYSEAEGKVIEGGKPNACTFYLSSSRSQAEKQRAQFAALRA